MSLKGKAGNECFPKMSFTQFFAYLPRDQKDSKGKKERDLLYRALSYHSKKSILEPSQVQAFKLTILSLELLLPSLISH